MNPFFPSMPNQVQNQPANASAPQQALGFNSFSQVPNHGFPMQMPVPFDNRNTHLNQSLGTAVSMPGLPNMQNGILGGLNPYNGFPLQGRFSNVGQNLGQFGFPQLPQNMNQMASLQQLLQLGAAQGQFFQLGVHVVGSQNPSSSASSQVSQGGLQETQGTEQKSQMTNGFPRQQVNHIQNGGNNISDNNWGGPVSKNFTRNNHGSGNRGPPNNRFQKPQFHHSPNANPRFGPNATNKWKGNQDRSGRGAQPVKSDKQTGSAFPRPLPVNYTEKEIQQWREDRKKNFPSKANVEKVGLQLKEILAKQAELGVEVAEIPPSYLSDHEAEVHKRDLKSERNTNGRPQKNKRGRHGRDKWGSKKQKPWNEAEASPTSQKNKREPSLLQKLLSADIKKDKSRILHALKFVVMNSFLDHWPENSLEFPPVVAEDATSSLGGGEDTVNQNVVCGIADEEDETSDVDGEDLPGNYVDEKDYLEEQVQDFDEEEGEITEL
ncbi:hypothetical protein QJS10_CPB17g01564 [Acorus calamus]|uniref:FMR1-interacting protein 1 conserved domain-containing protein n=1 Tax=Acorus calamus TaxID=4465 RepID=A0AAV9CR56_ACOCL|nr:hypothetical protein QJS10_CPB17g01564 [Acorus calamus]